MHSLQEVKALVYLARQILPPYGEVHGVPEGGLRLQAEFAHYVDPRSSTVLIVDDVLTTGGSINRFIDDLYVGDEPDDLIGLVFFARGPVPPGVSVLFTLNENLWNQTWPTFGGTDDND